MTGRRLRGSRGFAMMLILSVMTIVLIYLAAAQTALLQSRLQYRRSAALLDRAEATASVLAMASTGGPALQGPIRLEWNSRTILHYSRRPLMATDPLRSRIRDLGIKTGNVVVTIDWEEGVLPARREVFLIDDTAALRGAIPLADAATTAPLTAATPIAGADR